MEDMMDMKVLEKLKEVNKKLCEREKELAVLRYDNIGRKEKIQRIELDTYVGVCNSKTADGKPIYSNDKLREAEVGKRLDSDRGYTTLKEQYNKALLDIDLCLNDLHCTTRLYDLMMTYFSQKDSTSDGTEF